MALTQPPPSPSYSGSDPTLRSITVALEAYTKYLQRVKDELKALEVSPGFGVLVNRSKSGAIVGLNKKIVGGAATRCPFDGQVVTIDGVDTFQLTRLGLINGMAAANSIVAGALFSAAVSGTKWLVAECTADGSGAGSVITEWNYALQDSPSSPISAIPTTPPASFSVDLGVIVGGVYLRVAACGNFVITPYHVLSTERAPVECGVYQFIDHYTWTVSMA